MTAKEYLKQIQLCDTIITQRYEQLCELRYYKLSGGLKTNRLYISGLQVGDDIVERCDYLEQQINKKIMDRLLLKDKIIGEIEQLSNKLFIDILYEKYVNDLTLAQIAIKHNYSPDNIKHKHGYALLDFERQILKVDT